jgi:hypothetical protein
MVRSYNVRIARAITTDVEKLHMTKREVKQLKDGGLEIFVSAKNISEAKTDAALVATFLNPVQETICTRIILQKDLEPDEIRDFNTVYSPPQGEIVDNCKLKIVGHIENH